MLGFWIDPAVVAEAYLSLTIMTCQTQGWPTGGKDMYVATYTLFKTCLLPLVELPRNIYNLISEYANSLTPPVIIKARYH